MADICAQMPASDEPVSGYTCAVQRQISRLVQIGCVERLVAKSHTPERAYKFVKHLPARLSTEEKRIDAEKEEIRKEQAARLASIPKVARRDPSVVAFFGPYRGGSSHV